MIGVPRPGRIAALAFVACAFAVASPGFAATGTASPSPSPSASPTPAATAKPVYQSMTWRELGPALPGGRVANVVGSSKNPNLYYAAAAGGGVWKSTDGAETWNAVFEKQDVASIGDVALDPKNDEVVWVGTGEGNPRNDVIPGGGTFKSVDGGKTWKRVGLEKVRAVTRILIDPRDSDHVIVAALGDVFAPSDARGIYVTNDGGKTWSKTLYLSDRSGASDLAMDPANPNVLFAGMWHFERKPWTTVSGGSDDGLFKSTDGGKTWKQLNGHGLPEGTVGRIGLAIAPSNPKRVYALIEAKSGILWRSDDGGENWTLVSSDTQANNRPFYFSHVTVDPKNPDKVYGISVVLTHSEDGGKTFKVMQSQSHGDYHDLWIAPNDPNRMIAAEDGGVARSLDGGETWFFGRNLPVGEVYHVGVGTGGNPYVVCGGWQDNNAWCGPAFSTDPSGVLNKHWIDVNGGDGEWAVPDPIDPNIMWSDSQGGFVVVYDKRTRDVVTAIPYLANGEETFDISRAKYRFNWTSPIAFAPWDGHVAWLGGSAIFQTTDRGRHWTTISPDLTRNEKTHQQPSGGPITHDVSSAENYNTILDIEGSTLRRGEIWVGTDDGLVQVTLDGGKHWRNVTPAGLDRGAVETVAPSTTQDGVAYASVDRHLLGDYAPYLFMTRDFGKSWTRISKGIPDGQYARSVRQDLRNGSIVYAGTESGMWISCDRGTSWQSFKNNLPTVAVRDIRYQPKWDDMVVATHGRALYVMDDLRPLQQYACSKPSTAFVVGPRTAYEYNLHGDDEGNYTDYAANNPAYGAQFWYYQPVATNESPVVRIYDARGHLVRTVEGKHLPSPAAEKEVPWIKPGAGLQKFVWDFTTDGPVKWNGAGKYFKGPDEGVQVAPGRYTARVTIGKQTFTSTFDVKADPDTTFTQAEIKGAYDFGMRYLKETSRIDIALNNLDDLKAQLEKQRAAAVAKNDTAAVDAIDASLKARGALQAQLTANFQGFEDFIQRPGKVREDVQNLANSGGLVTPAVLDLGKRIDAAYAVALSSYRGYVATIPQLNATLAKSGVEAVALPKIAP